jgi:hypothetical protein
VHLTGKEYQMLEVLSLRKGTRPMYQVGKGFVLRGGPMNENEPARDAGQKTADKAAPELRLEVLQKTLHHIEATKHILDASGIRPEPLEVTLRNLEKLLDKATRKFELPWLLFRASSRMLIRGANDPWPLSADNRPPCVEQQCRCPISDAHAKVSSRAPRAISAAN